MRQRLLPIALLVLLVLIQYPLWLGKGGWLRVWELDRQMHRQQVTNAGLEQRNQALEGEVRDLERGMHAVEERARYHLGMVRPDEIFVQIHAGPAPLPTPRGAPTPAANDQGSGGVGRPTSVALSSD